MKKSKFSEAQIAFVLKQVIAVAACLYLMDRLSSMQ